jgi:hypothetical protein
MPRKAKRCIAIMEMPRTASRTPDMQTTQKSEDIRGNAKIGG